jgi:hypothetical protein
MRILSREFQTILQLNPPADLPLLLLVDLKIIDYKIWSEE